MKAKLFILLIAVLFLAFCGLFTGCAKKKEPAAATTQQVTIPESNSTSTENPKLKRAIEKTTEAQSEQRRSREE